MIGILTVALIFGITFNYIHKITMADTVISKKDIRISTPLALCTVAFIVRVILAMLYHGHSADMNCFDVWSNVLYEGGISNFYKTDMLHDYPPGYMYVLYVLGAIKALLQPSESVTWLILKMPAIICEILTGILIYKIACKYNRKTVFSTAVLAVYLFNPATILNSSLWGQIDSVLTLFIVLFLYLLTEKKLIASYFVFAVCVIIKPHAFFFFPLLVCAIAENVFMQGFDIKVFAKNLILGLVAIAMIFALSAPFGITDVKNQYIETLSSYPYFTVNAFNLWGAFGQNWAELTPFAAALGYIFLAVIVIYSTYVFFKSKNASKYFFVGAILTFSTFMLSTKMHDRYAFPTMALLLAAFAVDKFPKNYWLYISITLSQFFNTAWVLFVYEQDAFKYSASPVIVVASFVNLALLYLLVHYTNNEYISDIAPSQKTKTHKTDVQKSITTEIQTTTKFEKLKKVDYIFIASIMLIYSCIAFNNLGDKQAPQTEVDISLVPTIIDLGTETEISSLVAYLGSYNLDEGRTLNVHYLDSSKDIVATQTNTDGSVFYWNEFTFPEEAIGEKVQYIHLSTNAPNLTIKEIAVLDLERNIIPQSAAKNESIAALFDEQNLVPNRVTHLNSTYFDEIYHARTAYEFIHGLDVYEWTHPPLGKVLMAIGIKIFGMTPFGWRFIGTLFGVLMIPIIYIFAKRLCKNSIFAAITCVIFTFDFMHFTQTRIATIDVYVTFFIMLMYLFMYRYYTMSFYDTPLKKTFVPLGLCGISMGFAIASKWTGIYAGLGLAVLFFITLYKRYKEYVYAKNSPKGSNYGISHKHIIESFHKNTFNTIGFCVIFFVAIPVAIYALSYIPYLRSPSADGISAIIKNQKDMFTYHSETVVSSTHPFSSRWYEWIIMTRPIFYYSGTVSDTVREGISAFGNPMVWWIGVPAFVYLIYNICKMKDKTAFFIVLGYLAQLVSWIPITRTTYIYHYFPSVPFVTLMIGYSIYLLHRNSVAHKKTVMISAAAYTAITVGLFLLFYPVLSGAPCNVDFAEIWLKWFDSWVLL